MALPLYNNLEQTNQYLLHIILRVCLNINIIGRIIAKEVIKASYDPKFIMIRVEVYPAFSKFLFIALSSSNVLEFKLKIVWNHASKYEISVFAILRY